MQNSEYYGLALPEAADMADIAPIRQNFATLDAALALQAKAGEAVRDNLAAHIAQKQNPHAVTKAQLGLENVENMSRAQLFTNPAFAGSATLPATAMTDFLTLHAAPTGNMHAATKQYVDDNMAAAGNGDMRKIIYDTNNSGTVDNAEKVNGLTVLTAVPAGAQFSDTVYVHPATHAADVTVQDAEHRFVTDAEKAVWNARGVPVLLWDGVFSGGSITVPGLARYKVFMLETNLSYAIAMIMLAGGHEKFLIHCGYPSTAALQYIGTVSVLISGETLTFEYGIYNALAEGQPVGKTGACSIRKIWGVM